MARVQTPQRGQRPWFNHDRHPDDPRARRPDQYKVKRVYQTYAPVDRDHPTGTYLVQETLDPDNNPKTTTYNYNWNNYYWNAAITLDSVIHPDGYWEKYYNYDAYGHPTIVYSAQQDLTFASGEFGAANSTFYYDWTCLSGSGDDGTVSPATPRYVEQNINGIEALKFTVFPSSNVRLDISCPQPGVNWNDPGNLVTTTTNYASNTGRVQSVLNPDGTMQLYAYGQAVDGSQTNTVSSRPAKLRPDRHHGRHRNHHRPWPGWTDGSHTQIDIASGIMTSRETYGSYDQFSRPQSVTYLDGTSNLTEYACCGVDTTVDRDGVATYYQYDAAKRLVGTTRLGITTSYVLDSVGNILQTVRTGSDNSTAILSQSQYSLSGQLVAETNALGGVTTYNETTDSIGGLVRTTTYPDGGTRIEEYNLTRSLASVTGTAVQPVRYQYGVNYDYNHRQDNQYAQEIKLNADGSDSSEWVQSETDAMGRPCRTIYAAPDGQANPASYSYYNGIGQLTNSVDPDGVSTLCAYDAKGEQVFTATDLEQGGFIDFGGIDRITWSTNDVIFDHGMNVRRSQTFVWDTLGSDAPKLVSVSESSVDGLNSWQTAYRDSSVAATNHSQTVYGAAGSRSETTTAPDGSQTISAYANGQLVSATRKDSSGVQIGQTSYTYDAHGRQSAVTDARNGATVYGYNAADLAATITTPNPGNGGSPETTTTYYDTSLRATNTVQPDGTSVINVYYPGGQLEETYGSRTYPVAYTYDYAGRMQTMTTWQNFAGNAGTAVTTWNYDLYQGFLTNKAYADGSGPVYTYTPAGRLASRTWVRGDANGNPIVTSYAYDTAGSLTNVSYSDGTTPAVGTVYDRLGRPSSITQSNIVTSQMYNLAGELLGESYSGSPWTGFR